MNLKKIDKWKQPGPGMQLTAILSSLSGSKSVADEGIYSKEKFDEIFKDHMEQLLAISGTLHHLTWEDCDANK